jgi:hypothetical protein
MVGVTMVFMRIDNWETNDSVDIYLDTIKIKSITILNDDHLLDWCGDTIRIRFSMLFRK